MVAEFKPNTFIDAYCQAFANGGGKEIGQFYNAPCLTVRSDGSLHVFTSRQEIESFFDHVVDSYRDEGMRSFTCESPSVAPLGTACVSLSCQWIMRRADCSAIRRWHQTYVFKDSGKVWNIITAIFHVS